MYLFLYHVLDGGYDFRHQLHHRVFVRVFPEYFFQGVAERLAHVGIDVNLADADLSGFFKEMPWRAAAAVQADLAWNCITHPAQQVEVKLLGYRIAAVQVADSRRESINASRLYEVPGALRRRKSLFNFLIVKGLLVNVRAAAEVVGLALHQRAGKLGIFYDFFGLGDNLAL